MNSKFLNLKLSDFWKGLIVAVVLAIITLVYQAIQNGQFPVTWIEWKTILLAGLGAGLAYLIKNLFQNSSGIPFKSEPKDPNDIGTIEHPK